MNVTNKSFNNIIADINYDIDLLYVTQCAYTKNIILNHLRDSIFNLEFLIRSCESVVIEPPSLTEPINQTTFTLQTLSKYDGKAGNPAYVAINGTVYDVTNNAAWAAATHFGLSAGKDLSDEFAGCHAGQNILSKLQIVGRLV